MRAVDIKIRELPIIDDYYGFSLSGDRYYFTSDGMLHHNSGKSVCENGIIGHTSRFNDYFQVVGIDCKQVEFNLIKGVKSVKGVALFPETSAEITAQFNKLMQERFTFMTTQGVNNVYKIKDAEVDYYILQGRTVQFDEIYEVTVDLTKEDYPGKDYDRMLSYYPDKRIPVMMTVETLYSKLEKGELSRPALPQVKGHKSLVTLEDIQKTRGIYKPKALLIVVDEINELVSTDDYRVVDKFKTALSSIARLGRAGATHIILAGQTLSSVLNQDLKNNIKQLIIFGGFDSGISINMFDKDISDRAKPEIKGRGFLQNAGNFYELQGYYAEDWEQWEFDPDRKDVYTNPVFLKQCEMRGIKVDDSGFIDEVLPPLEEKGGIDDDLWGSLGKPRGSGMPERPKPFKDRGGAKEKAVKNEKPRKLKL